MCPQDGKKKDKVPGFFYNLKQMNPFAKKQPKERDPEAAAAPAVPAATDGDKEESKELLEKGEGEKGDADTEAEKKDEEKGAEGECMIHRIMRFHPHLHSTLPNGRTFEKVPRQPLIKHNSCRCVIFNLCDR